MLVIDETAVDSPQFQTAYLDGSVELLRELTATNNVDAALRRLSAIVRAARRLGLSRTQLHGRIRKYRLEEAAIA